jgi:peptidoglycan/xylan/chitin deacetylase (PgdA/CDA1 family)
MASKRSPARKQGQARRKAAGAWKERYRCAVTVSADVDCESLWCGTFKLTTPSPLSRGEFGARAGVPRLLDLFEKYEVPASWFIPAQTVLERPETCELIKRRALRPDIAYHGFHHESVLTIPVEAEKDLMARGMKVLKDFFEQVPRGNRSPPFALGPNTADLLEGFGFVYDSSLFGYDAPYRPRVPFPGGRLRNFVEVPVSWELDDAPYFLFNFFPYMSGLHNPADVLDIWKAEFDGAYADGACFILILHPEVIGRYPRMAMLEELVRYIRKHADVWWANHLEVAEEWKRQQVEQKLWSA